MKYTKDTIPIVVIFCASISMIVFNHTNNLEWGDDNASYIMQAIYLINNNPKDFIDINTFTIENSDYELGPIAYTWGYPALLALQIFIFGLKINFLKLIGIISYILYLGVLFFGFKKNHSIFGRLCFVSIFAFNPLFLKYTDYIGTDLPFLFFSTFAIVFIKINIIDRYKITSRNIDSAIIGLIISFSIFIRSIGLVLIPVLIFTQIISLLIQLQNNNTFYNKKDSILQRLIELPKNKNVFTASLYIPYLVIIVCIFIWSIFFPKGGGYYLSFLENISISSIKSQLIYYIELPSTFFAGLPFPVLIFGITIPLGISGLIKRWRSDYHSFIFIILYSVFIVIWPYQQGLRFLFPILPFYFSYVITGIESFYENNLLLFNKLTKLVFILPVMFVIYCFIEDSTKVIVSKSNFNNINPQGPYTQSSTEMFTFITENTEKESVIIFWKPRMMTFLTGRKSFHTINKENLWGDYLCIYRRNDGWGNFPNDDLIWIYDKFKSNIAFENHDFIIYKLPNSHPSEIQNINYY